MDITTNQLQLQQQQQPQPQPQPQRKTSKGRQKIEIKKVEKENSRYVTFSKRKNGIFKKAAEISTLCGAEVAVILFSEHGKVFSFGNPDVDNVLDRYIAETEEFNDNSCFIESSNNSSSTLTQTVQEQEYKKSLCRLEELKRIIKMIETKKNTKNDEEFWWNLSIDDMDKEELEGYIGSLQDLKKNVLIKIDEMASHKALGEIGIINQFTEDQNEVWNFEY